MDSVRMLIAGKVHPVRCGIRPINSRAAIVGGREAVPHSWPWQCAILRNNGRKFSCGCSIVSPDWVITATHCKYVTLSVSLSHVTLLCGGVRGVGLIGFLLQLNISVVTVFKEFRLFYQAKWVLYVKRTKLFGGQAHSHMSERLIYRSVVDKVLS